MTKICLSVPVAVREGSISDPGQRDRGNGGWDGGASQNDRGRTFAAAHSVNEHKTRLNGNRTAAAAIPVSCGPIPAVSPAEGTV